MSFEKILADLNKRDMMLDHLGQINDGKKWSATVRAKGSTKIGYGNGKTIEDAVKQAKSTMHDSFSNTSLKGAVKNPQAKKKRKRIHIRGK